jgi:hypothetical protein
MRQRYLRVFGEQENAVNSHGSTTGKRFARAAPWALEGPARTNHFRTGSQQLLNIPAEGLPGLAFHVNGAHYIVSYRIQHRNDDLRLRRVR